MSINCYESENLTIVWAQWELITWKEANIPTIRLHFSMLINGRIKTFYHEFQLCYSDDFDIERDSSVIPKKQDFLSLQHYSWWTAVLETLKSIWYMNDIGYSNIQNWIDKLYNQKK